MFRCKITQPLSCMLVKKPCLITQPRKSKSFSYITHRDKNTAAVLTTV